MPAHTASHVARLTQFPAYSISIQTCLSQCSFGLVELASGRHDVSFTLEDITVLWRVGLIMFGRLSGKLARTFPVSALRLYWSIIPIPTLRSALSSLYAIVRNQLSVFSVLPGSACRLNASRSLTPVGSRSKLLQLALATLCFLSVATARLGSC